MANPSPPRKVKIPYGELSALADHLGVSPGHLSHCIADHRRSKRIDAKVLELYGVLPRDLEPSRTRDDESSDEPAGDTPGEAA